MNDNQKINLLQKTRRPFLDQIFFFIFHYFKYILVLTQITVVGVFFFRFTVDQGIIDTKENIKQRVAMLKVTSGIVSEAKALEQKLNYSSEVLALQNAHKQILAALIDGFVSQSKIILLDYKQNEMRTIIQLDDVGELEQWQNNLKKSSPIISQIQVLSIQKASVNGYEISINFVLQNTSL